jgi:SPP1 family predicted phage head-tail adaptor
MSLAAGKLRHQIWIDRPVQTRDENGGYINSWEHITDVPLWAAIEPLSVREYIAAQATQSTITARITIRYRAGLTADMRILHGDKIYNPAGFLADKDSGLEYMTIPCTEGANNRE